MNESVCNSSKRAKVKPTDDILCTVNNNFINTTNNDFFNTINKEFLDEIKSLSQINEHEVNTNVTDIDFIVNCSKKNTDRVISNTDNTYEEVLSESYLENAIQEFKTLIANVKTKTEIISIQIISAYSNMPWKINCQIDLLQFLTLKYGRKELC